MTDAVKQRRVITLKGRQSVKSEAVEYRIIWNQDNAAWEVFRDGMDTGLSRRKKQSAIDIALQAVEKAGETRTANVKIVSVRDRKLIVEWP